MHAFIRVLLFLPSVALAHNGSSQSVYTAFLHPLSGWDHMIAMFLVGVIASQYQKRQAYAVIAVFMLGFFLSAVGVQGMVIDFRIVETGLSVSLILLGAVGFISHLRHQLFAFAVLAGAFVVGVFHGVPHALELEGIGAVGLIGLGISVFGVTKMIDVMARRLWSYQRLSCLMLSSLNVVAGLYLLSVR